MPKTSNQKGNEAELKALKHLERQEYRVHRAVRAYRPIGPGKYINISTDVYGVIDLIAKKKGERTRWIQVTVEENVSSKRTDLKTMEDVWDGEYDSVEIWRWVGGRRTKNRDGQFFWVYTRDGDYLKQNAHKEHI